VATLSPACSYAKMEKVGAFAFFFTFSPCPAPHVLTECTGEGAFFCALLRTSYREPAPLTGTLGVAVSLSHMHTCTRTHTQQARTASCTRRVTSARTKSSRSRRSDWRRRTKACRAPPSGRSRYSRSSKMTISFGACAPPPNSQFASPSAAGGFLL
jgi:hypothetical protein